MGQYAVKLRALNAQREKRQVYLVREFSIQVDCNNTASIILSMVHMYVAVAVVRVSEIRIMELHDVYGNFKGGKYSLKVSVGILVVAFPGD
ncbi:hypothetical protein PF66_05779 [Pseudomonas asplenii]|uniref:Uncharacterized protein n=1 Tax=Pseudomonas asplenii TaxID=53407 RepID=A0A0M9GCP3_9PSED|nr:hypothetical protein PF66_05779 [Pseudomonas fuscovaginae]